MDAQMPGQGDALRQYRLVEHMGRDALGDVWKAEHEVSRTPVMVRVLWPDTIRERSGPTLSAYLSADSPHLLPIIDSAIDIGWPHIVYGFRDATRLDEALGEQGKVDWASAAEVAAELLEGLGELHGRGLAFGQVLSTSVYIIDERVVLADVGVQAVYQPRVLGELEDADAVFGREREPSIPGDVAGVARLLWSMVTGEQPEGDLEPLASADPDAPEALDRFIAECRAPVGTGRYANAQEALEALRQIIDRALGVAHQPVDGVAETDQDAAPPSPDQPEQPDADAVEPGPPETSSGHEEAEDRRVRELMRRRSEEGSSPELDLEIKRLQVSIGCEQLAKAAGLRGKAKVARLGPAAATSWTIPVIVSGAAFVALWFVIQTALRGTSLDIGARLVISVGAPALLVGACLWAAVAVGSTKLHQRCLAVISETEVVCHHERDLTELLRLPAASARMVSIISAGDESTKQGAKLRITGWDEAVVALDFTDARLADRGEEEEEQ